MCWQSDRAGWKPYHRGSQVSANQDHHISYFISMDYFLFDIGFSGSSPDTGWCWRVTVWVEELSTSSASWFWAYLSLPCFFFQVSSLVFGGWGKKVAAARHKSEGQRVCATACLPHREPIPTSQVTMSSTFNQLGSLSTNWPGWRSPSTSTSMTRILSQDSVLLRKEKWVLSQKDNQRWSRAVLKTAFTAFTA